MRGFLAFMSCVPVAASTGCGGSEIPSRLDQLGSGSDSGRSHTGDGGSRRSSDAGSRRPDGGAPPTSDAVGRRGADGAVPDAEGGAPRTDAGESGSNTADGSAHPPLPGGCMRADAGCHCGWGAAQILAPNAIGSAEFLPGLATDAFGDAFVFWGEAGASAVNWSWKFARYAADQGQWLREPAPADVAAHALLAMDAKGAATTISNGVSDAGFSQKYGTYSPVLGAWSVPAPMPAGTWTSLVMSPTGAAFALSSGFPLTVTAYDPSSSAWSAPTILATTAGQAHLAVDDAGNAMVAWIDEQANGAAYPPTPLGISMSRFAESSSSWSAPARIYTGSVDTICEAAVAMQRGGGAVATFCVPFGGSVTAATSVLDPSTGSWSPPRILQGAYSFVNGVRLLASTGGDAMIIATAWQLDGGAATDLVATRFDRQSGRWGPLDVLVPGAAPSDVLASAIAGGGDAMVAWHRYDADTDTMTEYTTRYDAASGTWAPKEPFTGAAVTNLGGQALSVALAMSEAGTTFATWEDDPPPFTGSRLWTNRWACTAP